MPLVYRSMFMENSKPKVASEAKCLGARIPSDIEADADGNVQPGTGGMSVSRNWRTLPPHLIPRRLGVGGATGNNRLCCWRMGEGSFLDGDFADGLVLRVTRPTHGVIEPRATMPLPDYQEALAATCDLWTIDET